MEKVFLSWQEPISMFHEKFHQVQSNFNIPKDDKNYSTRYEHQQLNFCCAFQSYYSEMYLKLTKEQMNLFKTH